MRLQHRQPHGFTLVELIIASTISAMLVAAVYTILRQCRMAEALSSAQWQHRQVASALLDQMATEIESSINIKDTPAIELSRNTSDNSYALILNVSDFNDQRPTLRRSRYCWGFGSQDDKAGSVTRQIIPMAGSKAVSSATIPEDGSEEQQWALIDSQSVAVQVEQVDVKIQDVTSSDKAWKSEWKGESGKVAVKLTVVTGGESFERMVMPKVNAKVVE